MHRCRRHVGKTCRSQIVNVTMIGNHHLAFPMRLSPWNGTDTGSENLNLSLVIYDRINLLIIYCDVTPAVP